MNEAFSFQKLIKKTIDTCDRYQVGWKDVAASAKSRSDFSRLSGGILEVIGERCNPRGLGPFTDVEHLRRSIYRTRLFHACRREGSASPHSNTMSKLL
jgi:hypothetical protein